jgi:hypothetical protein
LVLGQGRLVADGIDAGVDGEKAAGLHATDDALPAQSQLERLGAGYIAVLASGQQRNLAVNPLTHVKRDRLSPHSEHF